jgi:hypothetical protein
VKKAAEKARMCFGYHTELSDFSSFSCVAVLAILVFSGILLLPLLLPVAATSHALEASAGSNASAAHNFTVIERLALGNVEVSKILLSSFTPFLLSPANLGCSS